MLFRRSSNEPICYQESIVEKCKKETADFTMEESIMFYTEASKCVSFMGDMISVYSEADTEDKNGIGDKIKKAGKWILDKLRWVWNYITGLFSRFFGSGKNNKENMTAEEILDDIPGAKEALDKMQNTVKETMDNLSQKMEKFNADNKNSDEQEPTFNENISVIEKQNNMLKAINDTLSYISASKISSSTLTDKTFICMVRFNELLSTLQNSNINVPNIDNSFLSKAGIPNVVKVKCKIKNISVIEHVLTRMDTVVTNLASEVGSTGYEKVGKDVEELVKVMNDFLVVQYKYENGRLILDGKYGDPKTQSDTMEIDASKILDSMKIISQGIEAKKDQAEIMKGFALPYMNGYNSQSINTKVKAINTRLNDIKNVDNNYLMIFGKLSNAFMDAMLNYDYMVAAGVAYRIVKIIQVYDIEVIQKALDTKTE